jgi:hypothetical protein
MNPPRVTRRDAKFLSRIATSLGKGKEVSATSLTRAMRIAAIKNYWATYDVLAKTLMKSIQGKTFTAGERVEIL